MHIYAEQIGKHDKFHDIRRSFTVLPAIHCLCGDVQLLSELRNRKTVLNPEIADVLAKIAFSGVESRYGLFIKFRDRITKMLKSIFQRVKGNGLYQEGARIQFMRLESVFGMAGDKDDVSSRIKV